MKMEKPVIYRIKRTVDEAECIKSFFFSGKINYRPGQFVMVWIPGVDEKPFAVSYLSGDEFGITVAEVGNFSGNLCRLKAGDMIGIRGPYGKGYNLDGELRSIAVVSGGHGAASLMTLAEEAVRKGIMVRFILGARSKDKLLYMQRLVDLVGRENLIITTDDGSMGARGFVTEALKQVISDGRIGMIFACGPEKMLKAVAEMGVQNKIKGELSMERYMKCGFGICGHCCVDTTGIRVCVEGPVLDFESALKIKEFGTYRRTISSRKEKI
ncbi:dihydroorotate dehydrogenase electron transfer subunit [Candidatus Woesearchaeota archaeon]|nr:dihydroorotate dehydrogenase electron transfer subunit [Candidatus Woesearchaeota archaeon]